ncbi:MAG: hypothetical protein K6E14_01480 [Paludibacteraceae bacterium]|nr:hypothetical protein [Paludibacteraceae bacterium]
MIKKAIISFFSFALCYSIMIAFVPNMGIGTHQWQENQIRAQRFLYEKSSDTVIVGTSLSARILLDSLENVKSCAFSACVVEDGLRLILSKDVIPHYILIETNYILRSSNEELLKVNTQGPLPFIRYYIPILREQNAPICLIGRRFMMRALSPVDTVDMNRLHKNIKNRILEDKTHFLTEKQMGERMQTIMLLVDKLEKRGAKIVLFEMPLNESLKHARSNEQTRLAVKRMFPIDKYLYLPNDTSTYLTNDGEHLDAEGQRRYSHFLKKVLTSILL